MRKNIFKLLMCFMAVSFTAEAQLKVSGDGKTGVVIGSSTPLSALSVGRVGSVEEKVAVEANITPSSDLIITGLRSISTGTYRVYQTHSGYNWTFGLRGEATLFNNMHVGVSGSSSAGTYTGQYRAWGVLGEAGNATSGYNYGIYGNLGGAETVNGAAVVGAINTMDINVPGRYAGYFQGNVKVTGTITATNVSASDLRLKKDIVDLRSFATITRSSDPSSNSALSNILNMRPIRYKYQQTYLPGEIITDTAVIKTALFDETSPTFQRTHYGLIAQELQELYSDLVYKDDNGYLSIDYIGLVPILIEAIKELKAEVTELRKDALLSSSSSLQAANTPTALNVSDVQLAALYQNAPNPFNQSTQIKFYLPATVKTAYLCIYDLQGAQLKQTAIQERGEGVQTLYGSELKAGMYLYTLIADGREVDTKRMILTK